MNSITTNQTGGRQIMGPETTGRYYIHGRGNNNQHALLGDLERTVSRGWRLSSAVRIGQDVAPFRLKIGEPKPRHAIMADHHDYDYPVFSDKIKQAIEPFVFSCAEFIPAQVETPERIYPYWMLHTLQDHDIVDRSKSDIKRMATIEGIAWINKLVIDYDRLAEINLEDRMLFSLSGSIKYLWHEDLVRAVEATQATGIRFFPADNYNQSGSFSP